MDPIVANPPLPPEVEGNLIFSKILPATVSLKNFLEKHADEKGHIYYAWMRTIGIMVCTDGAYAKHVLLDNHKNYDKSFGYEVLALFLGQGLLTSDGEFWLRQRRLAQPAFHRRRLASLARYMVEETEAIAKEWEVRAEHNESFDMLDEMMEVTMKIVARSLFSANVESQIDVISRNLERLNHFAMRRIQAPIRMPMWVPNLRNLVFRQTTQELDEVLFKLIEDRRESQEKPDDLLTMLMEAIDEDTGEGMTNQQLRDECMTIFVAGHETTAVSMTWLWYLMSQHPEVMTKLRVELEEVLGGRSAQLEDLPNLKYARMIINETLRLYPPGWLIGRSPKEDDVMGGYHVPKDTNVLLFTHYIHRRADLWDRPNDFWPERWETEKVKNLPKMSYIPFGGGPHLCIGNNFALMEMTFLLATLAQKFDPQYVGEEEPKLAPLITLRPKNKIEMTL